MEWMRQHKTIYLFITVKINFCFPGTLKLDHFKRQQFMNNNILTVSQGNILEYLMSNYHFTSKIMINDEKSICEQFCNDNIQKTQLFNFDIHGGQMILDILNRQSGHTC